MKYRATVTNINDDEKRGRIKVRCPALVTEEEELPFWIEPLIPTSRLFWIPKVDDPVFVEIEDDSANRNMGVNQGGLLNKEIRWSAYDGDIDSEFKTDYPKMQGIVTEDGIKFTLNDASQEINIQNSAGDQIKIANGSITITTSLGMSINLGASGITLDPAGAAPFGIVTASPTSACLVTGAPHVGSVKCFVKE